MWRMEFDNLIDSSQFFFLFEEEQQLRAIENKRVKERKKNSVEYVKFNDGAPPHLIQSVVQLLPSLPSISILDSQRKIIREREKTVRTRQQFHLWSEK